MLKEGDYMEKIIKLNALALIALLASVPALSAQSVSVDMRFNALAADSANYFNWTFGKKAVKDKFDAASGSSLSGSTAAFNDVRFDSAKTKKSALSVGLRGLLLFPLSDYTLDSSDAFTVTVDGTAVIVRYVHRGTAYELRTDKNGKLDVLTGVKNAKGLADNVGGDFVLKKEFIKAGTTGKKMSDLDWSKITLVADARDQAASRWYEGKLDFAYRNNILTVKGTLSEKKAK